MYSSIPLLPPYTTICFCLNSCSPCSYGAMVALRTYVLVLVARCCRTRWRACEGCQFESGWEQPLLPPLAVRSFLLVFFFWVAAPSVIVSLAAAVKRPAMYFKSNNIHDLSCRLIIWFFPTLNILRTSHSGFHQCSQ